MRVIQGLIRDAQAFWRQMPKLLDGSADLSKRSRKPRKQDYVEACQTVFHAAFVVHGG
jgi:hypothetical protein